MTEDLMNEMPDGLENLLRQARFVHLDSEDLERWKDGRLDPLNKVRVDAHLGRCLICENRARQVSVNSGSTELGGALNLGSIELSLAAAPRADGTRAGSYTRRSRDGRLTCVVARSLTPEDPSVTVAISSHDLTLSTIELRGGEFVRAVEFQRFAQDQVVARTVLDARDRQKLGDAELLARLQ